jgi:hypothetical protein
MLRFERPLAAVEICDRIGADRPIEVSQSLKLVAAKQPLILENAGMADACFGTVTDEVFGGGRRLRYSHAKQRRVSSDELTLNVSVGPGEIELAQN